MVKPLALYVVGRFMIFGLLFLALWVVGVDSFLAAVAALVVSIPLSYFLLRGLRDQAAAALQVRAERRAEQRRQTRGG